MIDERPRTPVPTLKSGYPIKTAFDQLQLELSFEINEAMTQTRRKLLEHFDDEVREKLRMQDESSKAVLDKYERLLMRLTRHELYGKAEFLDDGAFRLLEAPVRDPSINAIPLGVYELPRRSGDAQTYRLGHPLAEAVVYRAKERSIVPAEIEFSYEDHQGKVSILEPLRGSSGTLSVSLFTVESLEQAEDHLLVAGVTDGGDVLDEDAARRLLSLPGRVVREGVSLDETHLRQIAGERQAVIQRGISERNARFFEAEADKLEGWADDLKLGLEREIKEIDRQVKEARRAAMVALTLEEKLAGQKRIKALEAQRNERRRSLFDAQDQVDRQREALIENIEGKLEQQRYVSVLFTASWRLV